MLKEIVTLVILSIYVSKCSAVCLTKPLVFGDITEIDINDPGVIAAAYNANNIIWNDHLNYQSSEYVIQSAQTQIVDGIKYYLKIKYNDKELYCRIEITYRNWINKYSLDDHGCYYLDIYTTRTRKIQLTTIEDILIKEN
jgi:hypothetical protein